MQQNTSLGQGLGATASNGVPPANSAGSAAAAAVADARTHSGAAASSSGPETLQTASVLAPAGTYRQVRC